MNVYFRHPNIKFRPEAWGGVVQTELGIFPLDQELYQRLINLGEIESEEPDILLKELLAIDAICCISRQEAEAIRGT